MLSGRLDLRRGLVVLAGCFVVFGAPVIAAGLRGDGGNSATELASAPPPLVIPALPARNALSGDPIDPYAGAAVPVR
jgi:type IV secretion system protein VirB2